MTDRFGNEFVPGARVVYPTRRGSSLELRDGVVARVTPTTRRQYDRDAGTYVERPYAKLHVARECRNWKGEVKRCVVVLHELDRVVVVS